MSPRHPLDQYETALVEIYVLRDPVTGDVRYVGRANDSKQRFFVHLSRAKPDGRMNRCATWIRSLVRRGLRPALEVIETTPGSQWSEREQFWIAEFLRQGAKLTNENSGGYGPWIVSASTREKLSKACKGNKGRRGQSYSPQERALLSLIHKRRLASLSPDERRARTAAAIAKRKPGWNKGFRHTEEYKRRMSHAKRIAHLVRMRESSGQ